jgi:hypothetical protein
MTRRIAGARELRSCKQDLLAVCAHANDDEQRDGSWIEPRSSKVSPGCAGGKPGNHEARPPFLRVGGLGTAEESFRCAIIAYTA